MPAMFSERSSNTYGLGDALNSASKFIVFKYVSWAAARPPVHAGHSLSIFRHLSAQGHRVRQSRRTCVRSDTSEGGGTEPGSGLVGNLHPGGGLHCPLAGLLDRGSGGQGDAHAAMLAGRRLAEETDFHIPVLAPQGESLTQSLNREAFGLPVG